MPDKLAERPAPVDLDRLEELERKELTAKPWLFEDRGVYCDDATGSLVASASRSQRRRGGEVMDYDKLSDRELDALVAEKVMGWANVELYPTLGSTEKYWSGIDPAVNDHRPIPHYSTDDNAIRLVRNRIAELNLRVAFEDALDFILKEPGGRTTRFVSRFTVHQATPRDQAIAALRAVEQGKEPQ